MMIRVLDTDILTLFQNGHASVCRRLASAPPGSVAITVISVEEQFLGWYTRIRQAKADDELAQAYRGMTAFAGFIKNLTIISFDVPAIQRFQVLRDQKLRIDTQDLRIAAIALESAATLVTRNLRDFQRVSGLNLEDWSA